MEIGQTLSLTITRTGEHTFDSGVEIKPEGPQITMLEVVSISMDMFISVISKTAKVPQIDALEECIHMLEDFRDFDKKGEKNAESEKRKDDHENEIQDAGISGEFPKPV